MANNTEIYNAMLQGAVGSYEARWLVATEVSAYDEFIEGAIRIANAVDGLIPPTTVTDSDAATMRQISASVFGERFITIADPEDEIARAILVLYTAVRNVLLPEPVPPSESTEVFSSYRVPRITAKLRITTNVNLASTSTTVDGVTMTGSTASGQTIACTGQTVVSERGIYRALSLGGGLMSLTKITAFDAVIADSENGLHVTIREGVTQGLVATKGLGCFYLQTGGIVTAAPSMGNSYADLDVEDFWIQSDGVDFANAIDRCLRAMQCNLNFGRIKMIRQGEYYKSRINHIPIGVDIVGMGGAYKGTSTIINCAQGGFIQCSSNAGTTSAGVSIRNIYLRGSGSIQSKVWPGIISNEAIFIENVRVTDFPDNWLILRGKTSDDRGSINAAGLTTSASFVQPAYGETVQVQFASSVNPADPTAFFRSGTPIYQGAGGLYAVVSIDTPFLATVVNYTSPIETAFEPAGALPGATVASGQAVTGCYSNIDHSLISFARGHTIGLSGILIDGDNTGAMNFLNVNCTNCGRRALRGKNYGWEDRGFLNKTYTGCHGRDNTHHAVSGQVLTLGFTQPYITYAREELNPAAVTPYTITWTIGDTTDFTVGEIITLGTTQAMYCIVSKPSGTTLRVNCLSYGTIPQGTLVSVGLGLSYAAASFLSTSDNAQNVYSGCYTETSDIAILGPLNVVVGGHITNLLQTPGLQPAGDGFATIGPVAAITTGLFGIGWTTGRLGSNVVMAFTSTFWDSSGYEFKMPATSLAPTAGGIYAFEHAGLATKRALFFTGAGFANYGPGFAGSSRLLINGVRINCWTTAGLPAANTALENYFVGNVAWNPAATGAFWARVKTVIGSALTWEQDRLFGTNLNPSFSATLAANTAQAATVTVAGATVGQGVYVNPRSALPAGIQIDYCRISAANTVEIQIYNRTGSPIDCSGIRVDVTVMPGAV